MRSRLANRDVSFFDVLERGVYGNPRSPYRRLLDHFGISLSNVRAMVAEYGLEATLERLHDRGVYVTVDEFRGRQPIRRPGIEFTVTANDFDNPLIRAAYSTQTSGSTGAPSRILIDFEMVELEASYTLPNAEVHGLLDRPTVLWRPVPPDVSGIMGAVNFVKVGMTPVWMSQTQVNWRGVGLRSALQLATAIAFAGLGAMHLPRPRFVPRDQAVVIAQWLAEKRRQGTLGFVSSTSSAATRVAIAARQNGLDISGSAFGMGGEPYTPGKAAVLAEVGAIGVPNYAMAQVGRVAIGCGSPATVDDMHVLTDKLAVIQRERDPAEDGSSVPGLLFTSLLPSLPKIMLNTESGDYGRLEERDCGCPLQDFGYSLHVMELRAYDKLTSEGVTFIGNDLFRLVEDILPVRFGGYPTDFQLVEEEEGGLTRVGVIVSPSVGDVDEAAVIEAVIGGLENSGSSGRLMTQHWRQGNTLKVIRREPYASGDRKILPLHILRGAEEKTSV